MATILIRGSRALPALANASINALPSLHRLGLSPKHIGQSAMPIRSKTSPHHVINHRCISSTAITLHKEDDGKLSPAMLHSLYHEQMNEIQNERKAIFGSDNSDESPSGTPDLSQTAKSYFPSTESSSQLPSQSPLSSFTIPSAGVGSTTPQFLPPGWNAEEAYVERESLFAFTEEEQYAWNNRGIGNPQTVAAHNNMLRELIHQAPANHDHDHDHDMTAANTVSPPSSPFSHLTPRGDGVSMVDVGNKATTRRVALARSVVVFPPEVLSAFQVSSSSSGGKSEMIGPKGPIFETAKIAGILGAKKTSDLIPLCHPLPLDRVNIQIELVNNQAIIECECRVTHTTGVEMEALTGATIAALTIYDMVKAVSHQVEIGPTVLVSKSGGKSDFVRGVEERN